MKLALAFHGALAAILMTITMQPQSAIVSAGTTASFSSASSHAPPHPMQWQYSTNSGATWYTIFGVSGGTYSFVAAVGDSARQFRAFVSGPGILDTSSPAGLTVTSDRPFAADMDADGRSDLIVWRPPSGTWYWLTSSSNYSSQRAVQWGNISLGDVPLLGDIDGDGRADPIVWRGSTGTWYWLTSSTNYNPAAAGTRQWGNQAMRDIPLVGDADGDGKTDLMVFRESTGTWYWLTSSTAYDSAVATVRQFGATGDVPLVGDRDGDGRADIGVWRRDLIQSSWWWLTSSSEHTSGPPMLREWGNAGFLDIPFARDLDGDGKCELILWRPGEGNWYWLKSTLDYSKSFVTKQWGAQGDTPLIATIDSDAAGDLVVWRPASGLWFWLTSGSGYSYSAAGVRQWGSATATSSIDWSVRK